MLADFSPHHLSAQLAERFGARQALQDERSAWNYAQLHNEVKRWRHRFEQ